MSRFGNGLAVADPGDCGSRSRVATLFGAERAGRFGDRFLVTSGADVRDWANRFQATFGAAFGAGPIGSRPIGSRSRPGRPGLTLGTGPIASQSVPGHVRDWGATETGDVANNGLFRRYRDLATGRRRPIQETGQPFTGSHVLRRYARASRPHAWRNIRGSSYSRHRMFLPPLRTLPYGLGNGLAAANRRKDAARQGMGSGRLPRTKSRPIHDGPSRQRPDRRRIARIGAL